MGYVFLSTGKGCVIFSTIHSIQGFSHFTLGCWLCCQGCEAGVQDFEGESERV